MGSLLGLKGVYPTLRSVQYVLMLNTYLNTNTNLNTLQGLERFVHVRYKSLLYTQLILKLSYCVYNCSYISDYCLCTKILLPRRHVATDNGGQFEVSYTHLIICVVHYCQTGCQVLYISKRVVVRRRGSCVWSAWKRNPKHKSTAGEAASGLDHRVLLFTNPSHFTQCLRWQNNTRPSILPERSRINWASPE